MHDVQVNDASAGTAYAVREMRRSSEVKPTGRWYKPARAWTARLPATSREQVLSVIQLPAPRTARRPEHHEERHEHYHEDQHGLETAIN
jgi:hypothetical protein